MTESSFPLVGADFTSDQWSQTVAGLGNGVLDDWGSPYAITLHTNDTATIAVSTVSGIARAVVAGFGHRLTAAVTVSIPAVSSTTTYSIGLLYDPAQAATPVLLTVLTGTVSLTTGQVWLPLHVIVRQATQALTAAALSSPLLTVQPRAAVASQAALLQQSPQTYLAGTTVFCKDTGNTYRADLVGSTPTWVSPKTVSTFTPAGIYHAGSVPPALTVLNGRTTLEGILSSSTAVFVANTTYEVGSVPAAVAPARNTSWATQSNGVLALVTVTPAGDVTFAISSGFSGVLNLFLNFTWLNPT